MANDYCTEDRDSFCVNSGFCRTRAINFRDEPCDCSDEYRGRHCEYKAQHVQSVCSLTCSGNGVCQHGINANDSQGANKVLNLGDGTTSDFMHCVCNQGHAGINCEYDYIDCGGKNRYCFHGSTCVPEGGVGSGGAEVCECTNDRGVKRKTCDKNCKKGVCRRGTL